MEDDYGNPIAVDTGSSTNSDWWLPADVSSYGSDEINNADLQKWAQESGVSLSSLTGMLSGLPKTVFDTLKAAYTKKDAQGNDVIDWRSVAGTAGGLYGLYQSSQAQNSQPHGYQGKIPQYDYTRQQTNYTADPNRVPGSAGRRYFTDGQFVPKGTGAGIAATSTAPTAATTQQNMAEGGVAGLAQGKYLRGHTDGMADKIPTTIGGDQPAALSHGEFVIPADVVSHLGNGNSDAGAQRLYGMMDRIRKARTGTTRQGRQIDPNKFMPS